MKINSCRRQDDIEKELDSQYFQKKWNQEKLLEHRKLAEKEKLRLEKLHQRRQQERSILEDRLKVRHRQYEEDKKKLEEYIMYKESIKNNHLQNLSHTREKERQRQAKEQLERRNKVIENKYLIDQQEELATDKKQLELENRLKKSKKLYDENQKERINSFKRYLR